MFLFCLFTFQKDLLLLSASKGSLAGFLGAGLLTETAFGAGAGLGLGFGFVRGSGLDSVTTGGGAVLTGSGGAVSFSGGLTVLVLAFSCLSGGVTAVGAGLGEGFSAGFSAVFSALLLLELAEK